MEFACNMKEREKMKQYIFVLPCEEKEKKKIFLACDEIFSNIVSYSEADHIRMCCCKNKDVITVTFTDDGKKFNSLESNVEKEFEDFDEGGMGIMLVKRLCSDMEYSYTDGMNVLKLEFFIPGWNEGV